MTTSLLRRLAEADVALEEMPLVELNPLPDVWVDGIVEPVEIVGRGHCFRTRFYTLAMMDGQWVRIVVWRQVRAIAAYQRNQLGDMIASAVRERPAMVH